ncbi:integral membrane regulatory protein [Saccharopolyspora erythraea NRRL 2338]|uniref:Integral membrane regulatory protein n=1 Tax=Saccharopolyspora erythraea (strain ATCC 11635 / DSM 40517 / JCM 4748 / NBRC 13426 / NCIMB 8594 / NRRL 2338) TaxID=405948 RepID=A4FNK7_SACEN|nr:glycosyltransferase [Saccharopolyspora erythraea]EQD82891.1 integral membrane regulatory protein [Saccharopolyspora erythraea D]QRK93965.1 glycosyltransferase family 2 protein [Saccharopolyspora erythraea]CAM05632.1 integral membrane regulatory protein [Saccharopolyspora erythraea NRRL 2338]
MDTAPVLAVLVCHDGAEWSADVLRALRELTVGPRHVLAVDTGSSTSEQLARAAAEGVVDGVLELPAETGFGAAVSAALEHATERWGDPGRWLWLLHDDSAPEPDCLRDLLRMAELDSTAAMLGPLGLDWDDPRLVVDAGLSTDASGNRQTGIGPSELDPSLGGAGSALAVSEVLAVGTAGALVRRDVFERLGGFDDDATAFDDVDLGWRINADGHLVLFVPSARMRHARATSRDLRNPDAFRARGFRSRRAAERVDGVRTFLVNTAVWAYVFGVPRLFVLAVARAFGFALLRRWPETAAELSVLRRLLTGGLGLRAGRRSRAALIPKRHGVRGLLTSRLTRLRNGLRAAFAGLVRDRVRRDVVLGRRPESLRSVPAAAALAGTPGDGPATSDTAGDAPSNDLADSDRTTAPDAAPSAGRDTARPVGPDALPAGAVGKRVAGLRRPAAPVVVPVEVVPAPGPSPRPRPSPVPRNGEPSHDNGPAPDQELLLVPVDRRRVLRELLLTPPVVLAVALVAFALVTHGLLAEHPRFGPGLHGGRLLPVGDLAQTWADYLAAWHPVNGGTASPAPASLLVLGVLGAVFGGPPTVVSVLLLFGVPLAGVAAYVATRALPVSRTWRATAAGAYALLPVAVSSAAQGRVDVVVAHVLVPPLLAGLASVVGLARMTPVKQNRSWLGTACLTALGLAVVGAFAPLVQVALLALALLGFVLVPGEVRKAPRRVAGLTAVVLLSVACLLPWPVVLLRHPQLLLHGLGARTTEAAASGPWLLALTPSPVGWAGGLLVLAAAAALGLGRRRAMLPGVVVVLTGWALAAVVAFVQAAPVGGGPASTGWTGAPLVLVAAGALWMVLAHPPAVPKAVPAVALLVLAVGSALAGMAGPLTAQQGRTTPALAADLDRPGALLLVERGPQPPRLVEGRSPRFGDDDLVPVPGATEWLHRVDDELLSRDPGRVRAALASAAARGTGFVGVPQGTGAELTGAAGDLVLPHGRLADGSEVFRILLPNSPVEVLGPDLARQARAEAAPSPQARPLTVPAQPPDFAVRVSEGGVGRLLVVGAENEPGWQAWINGAPAPLATAWGHQVAVPLPEHPGEVRVAYSGAARTALLVVQAAAILFTVVGALPERRRRVTAPR